MIINNSYKLKAIKLLSIIKSWFMISALFTILLNFKIDIYIKGKIFSYKFGQFKIFK